MRTDRELTALFAGAVVDEAPDPTFLDELFAVLVNEVSELPTAQRPSRLEPWRRSASRWQLLVAASLLVAMGLGVLLRVGAPLVGPGATPSPSPSPAPSPTPAITAPPLPTQPVAPSSTLVPFTSSTYGYSITYPSNWAIRRSSGVLDSTIYPTDQSTNVDYFSASAPNTGDPGLIIAGPQVPVGTTLVSWSASIQQLQATDFGCPAAQTSEAVQIGGQPAQLLTWVNCPVWLLWAGVVDGDHAYHLILIDQYAVANPAVQAGDKALFLRILASVAFTSLASPSVSP
jgi:hypothetical protein